MCLKGERNMLKWLKTLFSGPEATHNQEPVEEKGLQPVKNVPPMPEVKPAKKAKAKKTAAKKAAKDLSSMTKPELLSYAKEKGVRVQSSMKKADILKAING